MTENDVAYWRERLSDVEAERDGLWERVLAAETLLHRIATLDDVVESA